MKFCIRVLGDIHFERGLLMTMMDFVLHGSRDPIAFVGYSGSYYHFMISIGEIAERPLNLIQVAHLEFYSKELGSGKRIEELIVMKTIINEYKINVDDLKKNIQMTYGYEPSEASLVSCIRCLNGLFF